MKLRNMNLAGVVHLNKSGLCIVLTLFVIFCLYLFAKKPRTPVSTASSNERINLNELLRIAIKAAENGGAQILQTKDKMSIEIKGKTNEGVIDPVTTADLNSHCAMELTLKHKFPNLVVISEETPTECDTALVVDYSPSNSVNPDLLITAENLVNTNDVTVWIDPLDATKEFTEKQYKYVTTMVCVAIKGKPVIGVIHKPFEDKTYYSWVGNKVGNIASSMKVNDDRRVQVIVSMSHSGAIKSQLAKSFNNNVDVITAAGAGYKILELVAGKADAYLHSTSIKKWDICAGNAILNSIGGRMSTKDNKLLDYASRTNALNSEGLVATIRDHDRFINRF